METINSKREHGFYWVDYWGLWWIAQWTLHKDGKHEFWAIPGTAECIYEEEISQVIENRLTAPEKPNLNWEGKPILDCNHKP